MEQNELIPWTDRLSVSIQEIDEQHKGLVDHLNQLHAAITGNETPSKQRRLLNIFSGSTRIHFLLEESLMRLTHYNGYQVHKQQHEELLEELAKLLDELRQSDAPVSPELLHALKDWLLNHIDQSDRRIDDHFKNSGLADYARWNKETSAAMKTHKTWWKFW